MRTRFILHRFFLDGSNSFDLIYLGSPLQGSLSRLDLVRTRDPLQGSKTCSCRFWLRICHKGLQKTWSYGNGRSAAKVWDFFLQKQEICCKGRRLDLAGFDLEVSTTRVFRRVDLVVMEDSLQGLETWSCTNGNSIFTGFVGLDKKTLTWFFLRYKSF